MRKLILFTLISIIGYAASAQFRLIDKEKSWNVLKSYKDQRTVSYKFLEDTLIDNKQYTSLYYSFSDRLDTSDMNFAGFLREDTAKGNVYLRFMNGEEFVIYNFKANVCDIINLPSYNLASRIYFEVEFSDSTDINGQKKHRLYLTSLDKSLAKDQIWIEGIGSNIGLIETGEVQYGRYWSKLLCVKDASNLLWSNRKGICYIVSGSNACKIAFKRNKRKKTNAKIISLDFEVKNLTVRVIKTNGKMIKEQLMKTRKDQTIYHIRKGDYLIEIVDNFNKIYFTKKLKIN
jgi:hypothetical protein